MQNLNTPITPQFILETALKRRWFIIIPFCLALVVGVYFAITLPRVYEAETLILVEAQRVPANYVQSLVSIDINARISTISQQILSRTNLEKIIQEFGLFSQPQHANMFLEDKLNSMRERINVRVTKARHGADAFTLAFRGTEPDQVMKVVNALASYFINENLKVRESQAVGTSDFLDDERQAMKRRLEVVEKNLRDYRQEHMGELPEQLTSNLSILGRHQELLSQQRERLADARKRQVELNEKNQFRQNIPTFEWAPDALQPEDSAPEELKRQLAALQTRYTDRHPDIQRLKRIIAEHESEFQNKPQDPQTGSTEPGLMDLQQLMNISHQKQARDISLEINELNQEIAETQKQIAMYQARIEATPKREQELMSLQRDYQNIQTAYSSLLNRKLEAEIAVNMERKQKGERFLILDSARLPEKPVSPDMKRLFLLTLAAGLGLGAGVVFLMEYLNTSFRSPEDLETYLKIPVLATVPRVVHKKDLFRNRINQAASIASVMVACALFAGFAALTLKGVDQTLRFIRKIVPI